MVPVNIETLRCKGCGLCAMACPKSLIKVSDQVNLKGYHPYVYMANGACTNCACCASMCPETAITIDSSKPKPIKEK